MDCVEEIVNVPTLLLRFEIAVNEGHLQDILREIALQSRVEFNYGGEFTLDAEDIESLEQEETD